MNYLRDDEEEEDHHDRANEYDEEIDETEDDVIENYLYLTKHCGLLRHSPTAGALDQLQQHHHHHHHTTQSVLSRQFTWTTDDHHHHFERTLHPSRSGCSLNDFNNNNYQPDYSIVSRVPPTIYYNGNDDDDSSFSLVKLFARMKARLNHNRRYRPRSTHELLHEEDSPEWYELTKNICAVLTAALLPNGGYDALTRQNKSSHHRRSSQKKSREYDPVLPQELEEEENKITFQLDDELNTEGDEEYDQIIWDKFRRCSRGFIYRRCGICKAVDRQQFPRTISVRLRRGKQYSH